jgi:predicted metal-dependent peptidase
MLSISPDKETAKAFDKAKFALLSKKKHIFLSTIFFSLEKLWTTDISTAATDGRTIWFNPVFFSSLPPDIRVFVIAHETWHVALKHCIRAMRVPGKYQGIANIAMDHVINLMLKQQGFTIWSEAYCDPRFENMSFEAVFNILLAEHKADSTKHIVIEGMGDIIPSKMSKEEEDQLNKQIDKLIIRAVIRHKHENSGYGDLPDSVKGVLDKLTVPKVHWSILTQKFTMECVQNSRSFTRPRIGHSEFILPSLVKDRIESIYVFFDVSGSITEDQLTQAYTELVYMQTTTNAEKITVIGFNTQITDRFEFDKKKIRKLPLNIGGGTDIEPVMKILHKEQPNIAIIFTDGEFDAPQSTYTKNCLWVISGTKYRPPFGSTIYME